jgi:hypothetical protein
MLFNSTLDYVRLAEEFAAWNKSPGQLRFGQYICNKYLILGKTAPSIFYETNCGVAYWKIVEEIPTPPPERV